MKLRDFIKHDAARVSIVALTVSGAIAGSAPAFAQEAASPPAQQEPASGEIFVTARKSAESILETPIAVSALTGEDIRARGIVSVQDIAAYTPGMKVVNNGAGRNDRSFQQIIIRGFTPPNAVAQTASVFIDGVPVSSATAINNITNPERVEVLKGPQAAYFGRQTFAGAVNVVSKAPSDHWTGTVDAMIGTRNSYDVMGEVSGPLVDDLLGIRATVRKYAKDGSYENAGVPGQTLGDQKTRTGTLALTFTPASNLTVKGFGMITYNDDGPSAQGLIGAYQATDDNGRVIVQDQSNCSFNVTNSSGVTRTNRYICGTAPKLVNSPSANTTNDAFIKNFLANPKGRLISPEDGVQGYGLRSRFYHLHASVDWEVADGVTLSSLTGMNKERNSELADLDNYYSVGQANIFGSAGSRSYFDFPFLVERRQSDWSQEFRARYDTDRFKGTVGVSYLDARYQNANGGGNNALGISTFSAVFGQSRNQTLGAFFGLSYDLTDKLTISVDGRYQIDKLYAYAPPGGLTVTTDAFAPAGFYAEGQTLAHKNYRNFIPRGIVQYQFDPDTMFYASYAKGINPAGFNTQFLTGTPSVQQTAAASGLAIEVDPEKLDNYEIGLKGRLLGNSVRYTLAAYRAIWKNQINSADVVFFDAQTNTPQVITALRNAGKVIMTGFEAEVFADVTDNLSITASGAINASSIRSLTAPSSTALTGITDFRGNENPLTSKYSAAVSVSYSHPIPVADGAKAFIRGDLSYKSGVYSDASNVLKSPDLTLVNMRTGIETGKVNVEVFVNNVFNTHAYTSVALGTLFTNDFRYTGTNTAAIVGLPDLRTAGLRIRYSY
ncbi:TonB-dependent receptor [Novosphingobium resinovorum]|uniref:TonB-dependent receptor n=1 Tax=Novosphingobium resinovorum TaxID=158500 RepID=A0A1D8AC96_9SPHN|nr:TonB-dependent receptor [Novosphingobium resinovorum]AOR79731.1 hypothetical protein BES08_23445 [Novosphingobium resinovorum]